MTFDPRSRLEQKGRRPALVISNDAFNRRTGLAIVCPVTNRQRDVPFHVALPAEGQVSGFVMVEQVKAIDFQARQAKRIDKAPKALLQEVLSILDACIY